MLPAAATILLGLLATPLTIMVLDRAGLFDVPNHRSSHTQPTVRGAGLGVALVGSTSIAIAAAHGGGRELFVVATAAAAYSLLGFVDDLHDLGVRYRLQLQVLLAGLAIVAAASLGGLLSLVAIVAVVGYLNAFNFMDGVNGISCLHATAVGITWTISGLVSASTSGEYLGAVLAATALAFLPYNFPRARAFLGDAGSYFFGGWIAVSAVVLYGRLPVPILVLPLVPYVADTGWTLVRRVSRGAKWHEAHREHAYQRLVAAGWSHTSTAFLVGGLTLVAGGVGLLDAYVLHGLVLRAGGVVVLGAIVIAYLALPSRVEGRMAERTMA